MLSGASEMLMLFSLLEPFSLKLESPFVDGTVPYTGLATFEM